MNDSDKELLKKFFDFNAEWVKKHDFKKAYNIEKFRSRLYNFIVVNNLQDNITFKIFMHDIEYELILLNEDSLDNRISKISIKSSNSVNYINNLTINKWFLMTRVAYVVDRDGLNDLNRSIEPKIKQNKHLRKDRFHS